MGNYWIRANPNNGNTGFDGGVNSAILRYVGADAVEPTTTQSASTNALVETNLHPLENPGAVSCPCMSYRLDIDVQLILSPGNQLREEWTKHSTCSSPS